MAIADLTITNEELEGKKISDIVGDTLVGTPAENKQKFDDYSDVLKEKFNELIDELVNLSPQSNVLEGVQVNSIDLTVSGKKVNIPLASTTNDGAMSTADKTKLDGLNKTSSVTSGGTGIPTSGAVHSAIQNVAGIASDTADFVVSYESDVEVNTRHWRVRKWDSGLCELWLIPYQVTVMPQMSYKAGEMYSLNVTSAGDAAFAGFEYPDNTFVSQPIENLYVITASTANLCFSYLAPRTASVSQRTNRTNDYNILCPRDFGGSTEGRITIGAYIVGMWK